MKKSSDTLLFFAILALAAIGIASAALGMAIMGVGLLLLAGCALACYALTGGEPPWGWARRGCERIRAWQRRESEVLRKDIMRHLASLSPEERAKEVERLTSGESIISMDIPDKESFLHPRNWPTGRINAPDGLSD